MDDVGFLTALRDYTFLQRALAAGLLVSATCAALSVFVVLKRLAFIGQGISHAAFGGIALGLLLAPGATPSAAGLLWMTFLFCVGVALAIGLVTRSTAVEADTAIGVLFSVSMALGLILLSVRDAYTPEIMSYLFGSILGLRTGELVAMLMVAALVLGCLLRYSNAWRYYLFDEEMATASGVNAGLLHYLLLVLLALTIVMSIQVVGIVLVSACLVIPGAVGLLLARGMRELIFIAQAVSLAGILVGLWASYRFALPPGATIVVVQFACFAAAWLFKATR